MLMRKFIEKSDQIEKEAYKDIDNGHTVKACLKAFKAGVIEGTGEGLLIGGMIYATIGLAYLICRVTNTKVE